MLIYWPFIEGFKGKVKSCILKNMERRIKKEGYLILTRENKKISEEENKRTVKKIKSDEN